MNDSRHWFMGLAPGTWQERRQAETEAMYAREDESLERERFEEFQPRESDDDETDLEKRETDG